MIVKGFFFIVAIIVLFELYSILAVNRDSYEVTLCTGADGKTLSSENCKEATGVAITIEDTDKSNSTEALGITLAADDGKEQEQDHDEKESTEKEKEDDDHDGDDHDGEESDDDDDKDREKEIDKEDHSERPSVDDDAKTETAAQESQAGNVSNQNDIATGAGPATDSGSTEAADDDDIMGVGDKMGNFFYDIYNKTTEYWNSKDSSDSEGDVESLTEESSVSTSKQEINVCAPTMVRPVNVSVIGIDRLCQVGFAQIPFNGTSCADQKAVLAEETAKLMAIDGVAYLLEISNAEYGCILWDDPEEIDETNELSESSNGKLGSMEWQGFIAINCVGNISMVDCKNDIYYIS
ncbi:hypothetical protein V1511DRAFT_501837 [Dipodascopsis uninucleata]